MSERRIISSDRASCPDCGGIEAIVRVRGNAFAATCTTCRVSTIAQMLGDAELLDAFGEHDELAPVVSIARAGGVMLSNYSPELVEYVDEGLKRALDVKLDEALFGVIVRT